MSQLQKLLDEKWPLKGLDKQDTHVTNSYRKAFTEGYELGVEDARQMVMAILEKQKEHFNALVFSTKLK